MIPPLPCPYCGSEKTRGTIKKSIDHPRYLCGRCQINFSPPRQPVDIESLLKVRYSRDYVASLTKFEIRQILLPWPYTREATTYFATAVQIALDVLLANGEAPPILLQSANFAPQWVVNGKTQQILVLDAAGKVEQVIGFQRRTARHLREKHGTAMITTSSKRKWAEESDEVNEIPCERCDGVAIWKHRAEHYQCFKCRWTSENNNTQGLTG